MISGTGCTKRPHVSQLAQSLAQPHWCLCPGCREDTPCYQKGCSVQQVSKDTRCCFVRSVPLISIIHKTSLLTNLHVVGMLRFMFDINQVSLPTPFLFCSCIHLNLYGPFNCISFRKFSRQLSLFWLCFSSLISALLAFSTIYLFMKVYRSPDIILCGWLGLTN